MRERNNIQTPESRKELTEREKEVVKLLVDGLSNKEIADTLGVTEKTVKFHITHIYDQTGHTKDRRFIANFWKTGSYFHPDKLGK